MKAIFYINMHSGLRNPEMELDEELSQKIQDVAVLLDKPFGGPYLYGLGGLGPNHYSVEFGSGPVLYLMAQPHGFVHLYKGADEGVKVEDTIGLWPFLNAIGGYVLQKYHAEVREAMKQYVHEPPDAIYSITPLDL